MRESLPRKRARARGADFRRHRHGRHVRDYEAARRLQGADPVIIASFLNSLQYRFGLVHMRISIDDLHPVPHDRSSFVFYFAMETMYEHPLCHCLWRSSQRAVRDATDLRLAGESNGF